MDLLSVSDAACELSRRTGLAVTPRRLTELFYLRRLEGHDYPVVAGRRLIPHAALPELARELHSLEERRRDEEDSSS